MLALVCAKQLWPPNLDNQTLNCLVIKIYHLEEKTILQVINISSLEQLHHESQDSHTKTVTSLNVCSYLKLFVSSSRDGTIKVWSFDNQLVSEIDFGVPLTSVGFANDQGDLLVGLQLRISIIKAVDYLPDEYYELSKNCLHWDERERTIAFDPHLEFWYVIWCIVELRVFTESLHPYFALPWNRDSLHYPSHGTETPTNTSSHVYVSQP